MKPECEWVRANVVHFWKNFKSNIVGIFYLNPEIPFEHCIIWNFRWSYSYNFSWNRIFVYGAHMAWALIIQQLTGYFGTFLRFSHFKCPLVYSILLLYFIIFSLIVASFFAMHDHQFIWNWTDKPISRLHLQNASECTTNDCGFWIRLQKHSVRS